MSHGELLALLKARDAELAARVGLLAEERAERDAALAAARAERDAALAAAGAERAAARAEHDVVRAERDAALASGGAERDSLRTAAAADRALVRSVLARDATLAHALAERDELRRLAAQPNVRAALLGERLLDVLPLVAAMGFAADVSQHVALCGLTWRRGDRGATNDMLVRSLEMQCGARAAHAARREDFRYPEGDTIRGSTQLIRAVVRNDLPRVLQLVQLGAPLDATDRDGAPYSALLWACQEGLERVAEALLNGKYEGRGANIVLRSGGLTPLMLANWHGQKGVVRLLLARGAR